MEYLIPLALVVIVAVLVVVGYRFYRTAAEKRAEAQPRTRRSTSSKLPGNLADRVTPTVAAQASARLDEDTHREVYQFIAIGQVRNAAEIYRKATGLSVIDSMLDVQAMSTYPQQWISLDDVQQMSAENSKSDSTSDHDGSDSGEKGADSTSDPEELTDLTIPQDWTEVAEEEPVKPPAFQVEVIRQDGTVRLSSDELPPWLQDQMLAMVRDGRIEDAAKTLSEHSILTLSESRDLMKMLAQQYENGGLEEGN